MKKILIADDEQALRFFISELLSLESNYIILEAKNGLEAIDIIDKESPDLVLLDVIMPDLTGYEVAKILNQKLIRPKIIILTARLEEKNMSINQDTNIDYFLSKPFDAETLLNLVTKVLGE